MWFIGLALSVLLLLAFPDLFKLLLLGTAWAAASVLAFLFSTAGLFYLAVILRFL
jgi:hypothetical protein